MSNKIAWIISISATIIALIHITFPNLMIDSITLTLIVIAIIPWLAPLLKSIELPGGTKIELRDLEKVEEKAKEVGLITKEPKQEKTKKYFFQDISYEDPQLALANLRIEIEKRLRKIAELKQISLNRKGFGELLRVLSENNLLSQEERSVLLDLVGLLNKAVHSEIGSVDYRTVQWALDIGPEILKGLDERLE